VTAENAEVVGGSRRDRGGEGRDVGVGLEELGGGRRGRRVEKLDRMRRDCGRAVVEGLSCLAREIIMLGVEKTTASVVPVRRENGDVVLLSSEVAWSGSGGVNGVGV
jgi:hypothetical protein